MIYDPDAWTWITHVRPSDGAVLTFAVRSRPDGSAELLDDRGIVTVGPGVPVTP